jgi:hypothetical protein
VICQRCGQREATQGAKIFNIMGSGAESTIDEKTRELCDECNAAFTTWLAASQDFVRQQVQSGVPLHQAVAQAEERFPRRTLEEFLGLAR